MPTVLIIYSLNNLQRTILQNIILFWKQIAICLIRCANESHEKLIMITTTKHNKTKSHTYLIGYTVSSVCVCIASSVESRTGVLFVSCAYRENIYFAVSPRLCHDHIGITLMFIDLMISVDHKHVFMISWKKTVFSEWFNLNQYVNPLFLVSPWRVFNTNTRNLPYFGITCKPSIYDYFRELTDLNSTRLLQIPWHLLPYVK